MDWSFAAAGWVSRRPFEWDQCSPASECAPSRNSWLKHRISLAASRVRSGEEWIGLEGLAEGEWQEGRRSGYFRYSRAQGMGLASEWALGLRAGYVVAYGVSVAGLTLTLLLSCSSRAGERGSWTRPPRWVRACVLGRCCLRDNGKCQEDLPGRSAQDRQQQQGCGV